MSYGNVSVMLVVAGLLAAAQPSPQAEVGRLMSNGQFAEARQIAAGLVENAKRTGSSPAYQAGLWHLLGAAENRLGRYKEAEAALKRGVQVCDSSEPPVPELKIALLVELAEVNLSQTDLEDANRVLRQALGTASKDLAPGHPRLAAVHHSLGVLFWIQGQLSRAEKAFRLSLTIIEGSLGPDDADVAVAASGLAGLLTTTGRRAEAIPLLERAKAIFEKAYGLEHPDTIGATYALGVALAKPAPAKGELMLRQAISNWRASQPNRHPHMIKFLSALAESRRAQGDYLEAGILSEQALQMSKDIFGPEHPHVISQMYHHALMLKAASRRKEAAALKREADRIRTLKGYAQPERHRVDILALR